MEDKLLPIHEIVNLAKQQGVDFGKGNPQNRLRYLAKHSLIPHARRKLLPNSANPKATIAHYPTSTINRLRVLQRLRDKGFSIRKIKDALNEELLVLEEESLKLNTFFTPGREINPLLVGSALLSPIVEYSIKIAFPFLLIIGFIFPSLILTNITVDKYLIAVLILFLRALTAPFSFSYLFFSIGN